MNRELVIAVVMGALFASLVFGPSLIGSEPTQVLPSHNAQSRLDRERQDRMDRFAAHALSGMLSSERFKECDGNQLARNAWRLAEYMERGRSGDVDCQ